MARMAGSRLRCSFDDTPPAEEAPEQEAEEEEEARGLFSFRRCDAPSPEFRKYSCR